MRERAASPMGGSIGSLLAVDRTAAVKVLL